MSEQTRVEGISRRRLFSSAGEVAVSSAAVAPVLCSAILSASQAPESALNAIAGVDRITIQPGRTFLHGWAGYGQQPGTGPRREDAQSAPPAPIGPQPKVVWSKESGPGTVRFADAASLDTTATFTTPGKYVIALTADNGQAKAVSKLGVLVEPAQPQKALEIVETKEYKITSPLWKQRIRALAVNWIPHCIDQINRTDLTTGQGGIDNFIEAAKALRGQPHGVHKGYVFSNAWVYQTIESMSLALMIDPQGDAELLKAHARMRQALEDWIPKILAAQEPDGYLQTAFTLPREGRNGAIVESNKFKHWDPARRHDHEGYVAGYLVEAAISHHRMSKGKDRRLYDAAKKLADCWDANLGPAPKKPWYDEHQGMEQALVRFARYVDEVEGAGKGTRYSDLARFLLDNRYRASVNEREKNEYSQSHRPVTEQYEAVGHAVRAVYTYSAMADVVIRTGDVDYRSAAKSLWNSLVNRKYYVTGGIGSGETSEGFGADYSLRNRGYCESCSSCGMIFFLWKMGLIEHDAQHADIYEETLYNALLGSMDLEAKHFYYDNPLDARVARYRWHVCPCCVGNIPRTLMMLPSWMYAKGSDGLYVNLFAGSSVVVEGIAGTDVEMVQETDYPWSGNVRLTVNPKASKRFSIRVRMPNRSVSELYSATPDSNGIDSLAVNGTKQKIQAERGYAVITRNWKPGDVIELELPMKVQRIHGIDKIEATRNKVALRYGPLIYNIEQRDQDITKTLAKEPALKAEWKQALLGGVVAIEGTFADRSPLLAVPNFARMNREPGTEFPPQAPPPGPDGRRPAPPPPKSIVWIDEA